MPSTSPAQARLMAGVAHDTKFAAKVGIPQKVGGEFNKADQLAKANALRKRKPAVPATPSGMPGSESP